MNAIEVQGLKVSYGDLLVLNKLSFNVTDGEVVALIGPSGCGKSTLLRLLAGTIPKMIPAQVEGSIKIKGASPETVPPGTMEMIFQEENLLPWRTTLSNVNLGQELLGKKNSSDQAEVILALVGLTGFERAFPRELSGGMKQRVALASALYTSPDVLLMDEPLGALDALTREEMWTLLEEIHQEKPSMTMVLVTHHVEEAVVLADKVIVMGRLPSEIIAIVDIEISRPRLKKGVINEDCLLITNLIRSKIRRINNG
jgi:NitT/TauT family transport system ATP-binding protein